MKKLFRAIDNWWFWLTYVSREDKITKLQNKLFKRMLRGKGITLKQIKERVKTEPEWQWYRDITWTQAEEDKFKKRALPIIKRKLDMTNERANKELNWFLLMWGLHVSDYKF